MGGWIDGLQAQKGMEGSRGASAECVRVHTLSQSQNNNNPGMGRAAGRPQRENEHRAGWGKSQRKHAWSCSKDGGGNQNSDETQLPDIWMRET